MQLDSYETRKNNAEIGRLQGEVKQTGAVLEAVLGLCDDETKTSGEILDEIHKYLSSR